jgi:hypothetical protein
MARFYFHLRDSFERLLDAEGIECVNLQAVKTTALNIARDLIAHDAKAGVIDMDSRIDVEDAHGQIVHTLAFEAAVILKRSVKVSR